MRILGKRLSVVFQLLKYINKASLCPCLVDGLRVWVLLRFIISACASVHMIKEQQPRRIQAETTLSEQVTKLVSVSLLQWAV